MIYIILLGLQPRHVKLTFQNGLDLKSPYHHQLAHPTEILTEPIFQVVVKNNSNIYVIANFQLIFIILPVKK